MTHLNLLLRGGSLIDGTGAPARRADVLVVDGKIDSIGPELVPPPGTQTIDVTGRHVTPGFVDLHSHADMTLLAFPSADSALRQGITTVATGNCGGGVAPIVDPSHVGDVAFAYEATWGISVDWRSFGDYAERLDGAGVNVAPLVAHGAVRNAVLGLAPRPATRPELDTMCSVLREALDEGAFGMSSGLEYQPGVWAGAEEMRSLVTEVARRGRVYATHMRGRADEYERATTEALDTTRGLDVHLQLSHFAPRPNAADAARQGGFAAAAKAAEAGRRIGVDTFPEIWGPALLIDLFPEWVLRGSTAEVLARLDDPALTHELEQHFEATPSFLARIEGYRRIFVTSTPDGDTWAGTSLPEIARELDTTVAGAAQRLLAEAGDHYRSVAIRHVYATERDLDRTMQLPYCSIASDGVVTSGEGHDCALPWNASSYGYVARMLGHHVRERGLLSVEEAVRRMTSLPAEQLGLRSRGTVEVGAAADLVVIDLDGLHDRSTPDDMARHPTGLEHVVVNGRVAFDGNSLSTDRHGRLLRP